MTESGNIEGSIIDLSEIDTKHLANQALKLFSKRYGLLYDNVISTADADRKGYVTWEDVVKVAETRFSPSEYDAGRAILEQTWLVMSGGHPPSEVPQMNRQQLIDLCVQGYHSKDQKRIQLLKDTIKIINKVNFDIIDVDSDGLITENEFSDWAAKRGVREMWSGAFQAMDLNNDGLIDREEFLKCHLGFFFYADEERYNHFFGVMKY